MSSLDKIDSVGRFPGEAVRAAPASTRRGLALRGPIGRELVETLKLSLPIALTQLGQIAMMTTDLALIGRLGNAAVAAAAMAHTVFFVSFTVGMGLVSAVAPLAAQAFGARDPRTMRRALRAGLWAALFVSAPLLILPAFGEAILVALGQAQATAHDAQRYLSTLMWGLVPGLWFMAIRGFIGAVNRPGPGLWITLAAVPANAVLGFALIYGEWGLPRLDLVGAGLATALVNAAMCAVALIVVVRQRPFRKYNLLARFWRIDWTVMRRLFIIGAPISASFLLEYGLFAAAALLMGLIGTTAIAAHQVALQVAAILFMVPFGISMAATVRVGQAVGRGDSGGIRRAGLVATALGIAFMAVMTLTVIAARFAVAEAFFGLDAGAQTVVDLTATLLLVGSTFFVADGIQTVAAGALRGLNDTRVPLLCAVVSYWLIGFCAACVLGFRTSLGAPGVWIGLSIGTAVYAVLLVTRFLILSGPARPSKSMQTSIP